MREGFILFCFNVYVCHIIVRFLAEGEPCRPEWHPHNRNNAASKSNQAMVEEGEEPGEICAPGLKCARMTSTDGEEGDGEAGSETYRCVGKMFAGIYCFVFACNPV